MTDPSGFCGQCGQRLGPGDVFCGQCGEPVAPTAAPPSAVASEPAGEAAMPPRQAGAVPAAAGVATPDTHRKRGRRPWLLALVGVPLVAVAAFLVMRALTWHSVPPSALLGATAPPYDEKTLVSALAFSGDGQILGVGTYSGLVSLWHPQEGRPITAFRPRVHRIDSLAINDDATLVAMGFEMGIVALWDQTRRIESGVVSMVADPASLVGVSQPGPHGNPRCLSFQPGGRVLLSLDSDYSQLRFFDLASSTQYKPIRFSSRTISAALLSPDQRFLALGDAATGTVEVFDLLTRRSLGTVSGAGARAVRATAVSPDGSRVAEAQAYALFSVWDVATRTHVAFGEGPPPVTSLAFSPDGSLLASGGQGVVIIWEAATCRELRRLDLKAAPPAS